MSQEERLFAEIDAQEEAAHAVCGFDKDKALPKGWVVATSHSTGGLFYHNTLTGESTYTHPALDVQQLEGTAEARREREGGLPRSWLGRFPGVHVPDLGAQDRGSEMGGSEGVDAESLGPGRPDGMPRRPAWEQLAQPRKIVRLLARCLREGRLHPASNGMRL